jgi:hypothetical protein
MNVVERFPAGTLTPDGTTANGLLLRSVIFAPPTGAASLRVRVPIELAPPRTLDGFRFSDDSSNGLIVKDALTVVVLIAVIFAVVTFETVMVVTKKVVELAPAGIVTVFGTLASKVLLPSEIFMPAVGAGPLIMIVPVEGEPPGRLLGLKTSETSFGASTVRVAFAEDVP